MLWGESFPRHSSRNAAILAAARGSIPSATSSANHSVCKSKHRSTRVGMRSMLRAVRAG